MDNCQDFDGTGDYIGMASQVSLTDQDFTVAAWFKTASEKTAGLIGDYDGTKYFGIAVNNDEAFDQDIGEVAIGIDDNGGGGKLSSASTASTYNDSTWHMAAGKREGTNIEILVDGISQDTTAIAAYGVVTSTIAPRIGTWGNIGDGYSYVGQIDEVRLENTARSTAWLNFVYHNIFETGNELTRGEVTTDYVATQPLWYLIIGQ